MATLSVITQKWRKLKFRRCVNDSTKRGTATVKYHSPTEKNELKHAATWMDLRNITLSKRSQAPRVVTV